MLKQLFTCNRWFTYVCGLMLSLISGVPYVFGAIAPKLKETMGYEQYQINMIGTLANVSIFVPSFFYSYAGPRATCLLAACMGFGGYFLIYCGVMHWFHTNYIVIGLFFAVMQNGTSAGYITALSTNIRNFTQGSRGVVVGSMAACLSISSAIFTFFYSIVFKKNLTSYLFFCSIVGGTIPLISSLFMNVVQKTNEEMWPSIEEQEEREPLSLNNDSADVISGYGSTSVDPVIGTPTDLHLTNEEDDDLATDEVFKEVNPLRMLLTLDFWLLFVVFFAGVGSAYVINNNLGSIVISLGAKDGTQNPMVLMFAGGNFSGRIIAGILSDRLSKYINRITILNIAVLGIGLVHYGFVFATVNLMYPLMLLLGLVYGSLYSMMPSFLSDRFGQRYFAINFEVVGLAPTAGSYLLATLLASSIYKYHSKEGSKKCFGRQCYQLTFVVCTGVCVLAYVVGLVLMYRSRKMYDTIRLYKEKGNRKSSEAAH